ncbi:MAG TPA: glycosyltransferase family 1 protein [Candidatus Dormibacteraeota bacterium]
MAGPGIRAWELCGVLAREHEVALAAPGPLPAAGPPGVRLVEATRRSLRAEALHHDVAVVQGSALDAFEVFAAGDSPLVLDLYDPYVLESAGMYAGLPAAARAARAADDAALLRAQLAAGDAFLCASGRQRRFWLGALAAAGRVNPSTLAGDPGLEALLRVVPFGLPEEPAAPGAAPAIPGLRAGARLVVWAGGIWNWLDPETLIRAAAALAPEAPELQVLFLGGGHPSPGVPAMERADRARRLAASLGLLGTTVLFREGWTPYAERASILTRAAVGVSLHEAHVEAEFAFRTRVLDYLWAGVPCLLSSGEATADLCVAEGFGLTAAPGDQAAVTEGLRRLLTDPELHATCRAAALRTADRFTWPVVAAPLLDLCREPRRAGDLPRDRAAGRESRTRRRGVIKRAWESGRSEGPGVLAKRARGYLRRRLR